MVEPIDEILQELSLLLLDSEKLGVRLRLVEHAHELADELLAELSKITNRSGLKGVIPLSDWAL